MQEKLPIDLKNIVKAALVEDVGHSDVTAQLVPENKLITAQLVSNEKAILCGVPWFNETFAQLDENVQIDWQAKEGKTIQPKQIICYLVGPARTVLTGERTAMNFLQLLSGTATQAGHYAQAIQHTRTKILDTRKTVPGLRTAQKYAVRCGGGTNHRMGLYDAFLIKENHIMAAGSIAQAVTTARTLSPELRLEVEVENLQEIQEALKVGVKHLLLDNFNLSLLKEAVALVNGQATLEASGNVDLKIVVAIAETGVDYISIGSITKHVQAIDFSMRVVDY